jgi:ATP-binding cassette subfamily F protein 3
LDEYQRYLIDQSKALKDEQSGKKTGKNNPSSPSSTNTQDGSSSSAGRSRQDKKLDSQKRSQLQRERQALLSPVKKELQETESRLQSVQLQLQNLEASLMEDLSPQERAQNGKTIKSLQEEANELEEKWLQLGERIEQLST